MAADTVLKLCHNWVLSAELLLLYSAKLSADLVAELSGDAEFSRELGSEGGQTHIVARLVERAEASEVQLAQAQQELRALKQVATARAAAEGAGTSAAMSAAQVTLSEHLVSHQIHLSTYHVLCRVLVHHIVSHAVMVVMRCVRLNVRMTVQNSRIVGPE